MHHEPSYDELCAFMAPALVSRETYDKLILYVQLLHKWQKIKNLVAPSTLEEVWQRHIYDSLQLISHGLPSGEWVDFGSGAGFPGLVIAIASSNHHVSLVEANQRKCAFMAEVSRETGVTTKIFPQRIEDYGEKSDLTPKTISARALASLTELCGYVQPHMTEGSIALFPKGQDALSELTTAQERWTINYETTLSRTDKKAQVVIVKSLKYKEK